MPHWLDDVEQGSQLKIAISGQDVKKAISHGSHSFDDPNEHHHVALAALPALLEHATLCHSEGDEKRADPSIHGIHGFAAPLRMRESHYLAHMTVMERRDGTGFCDHHLRLVPAYEVAAGNKGPKVRAVHDLAGGGASVLPAEAGKNMAAITIAIVPERHPVAAGRRTAASSTAVTNASRNGSGHRICFRRAGRQM